MNRNPVIVHLSDLHFGPGNHDQEVEGDLARVILSDEPRPDFIVVTGDLTQWGRTEEMRQARAFLENLLAELWISYKHAARCIVVPGNHDLLREKSRFLYPFVYRLKRWNGVFGTWGFTSSKVDGQYAAPLTPVSLKGFYLARLRGLANEGAREEELDQRAEQLAREAQRVCEYFPHFQVAFVKMNSNVNRVWSFLGCATGETGRKQLDHVEQVVRDYGDAFPCTRDNVFGFDEAHRIALVHHHVTYLPGIKYDGRMLMQDAGDVWQRLAQLRFEMLLHGHRHQATQITVSYRDTAGSERHINVLSAGTATAFDKDDGMNSFYRITTKHFGFDVLKQDAVKSRFSEQGSCPKIHFSIPFRPTFPKGQTAAVDLLALDSMVDIEDDLLDHRHEYDSVDFQGFIDGEHNYHGCYIFEGRNISESATDFIPFSLTAVGAHGFRDFELTAYDLLRGSALPAPEVMKPRPIMRFPIRVLFAEPLDANLPFKIKICFKLSHVMHLEDDFDFVNLLRFPKGVKTLAFQLCSTSGLVGPRLFAVGRRLVVQSGMRLEPVFLRVMLNGVETPVSGFKARVSAPQAHGYMFYYHKLGAS